MRSFPFFVIVQTACLERYCHPRGIRVSHGTRFFTPAGDPCPNIGFLLSGEIRVFKEGEIGREITLYEIYPGEACILNASSIITHTAYPATATAITDIEMLAMPEKVFRELLVLHEDMRTFIFRLFSNRLSLIIELVEEVAFGKMDERLMEYLIEKAEDGKIFSTHRNIANDLGTSREVISRLLKDIERKGNIIISRKMIQLVNDEN